MLLSFDCFSYVHSTSIVLNWIFGLLCITLGIGNDLQFGVFMLALSILYLPTTYQYLSKLLSIRIHPLIKILPALTVIWINLAVGAINEGHYPEITG